jgi:hypothetical protein
MLCCYHYLHGGYLVVIGFSGGCFAAVIVGLLSGRCFAAECVLVVPPVDALPQGIFASSLVDAWLSVESLADVFAAIGFLPPPSLAHAAESVRALSWQMLPAVVASGCFATVAAGCSLLSGWIHCHQDIVLFVGNHCVIVSFF